MTPDKQPRDLVPLQQLTDLARLGLAMRRAQNAYFEAKRKRPGLTPDAEWRHARDAEKRFDRAIRDSLTREQVPLPGMEGGEGGG